MNTTTTITDEIHNETAENPGVQLARAREQKGYSQDYVAGKLHLRVRIIELLETDDYQQMPEPVFIKGYLRAYAKLLGLAVEPLLDTFNKIYSLEKKSEKTLWQGKNDSYKGEWAIRWLTGIVALAVIISAGWWWQKNKDHHPLITTKNMQAEVKPNKTDAEIKLTDLSKMQFMISPPPAEASPGE